MRFILFLAACGVALGLSALTFADTEEFVFFGRWIIGMLAIVLWVCIGVYLFMKVEN